MFDDGAAGETGANAPAASLASLWGAMTPRVRAAPPPPPDVPALLADAEARGRAAGQGDAEAALAPLRAQLVAAAAALDAACAIDAGTLAPLFADLVTRIARAVVGGELRLSGEAVERLVHAALALVANDGPATLFVAEADASMLSGTFPSRHAGAGRDPSQAAGREMRLPAPPLPISDDAQPVMGPGVRRDDGKEEARIVVAVDPALAPGEIRVETARHVVAASLDARLADIVPGLA